MNNQVTRHREKVESVLSGNTFSHQINAAQRAFRHFDNGSRAVVIAAEMQSGKSGIALALREGANKRGNSSRLTQSFHFFMFEPFFLP